MMHCTKCGKELPSSSVFCAYCGERQSSVNETIDSAKPPGYGIKDVSQKRQAQHSQPPIVTVIALTFVVAILIPTMFLPMLRGGSAGDSTVEPSTQESEANVGSVPTLILQVGDSYEMGGYKWNVLDIQDDKALIITEEIIELLPYSEGYGDIAWKDCTIRAWLNNEFYSSFNADEQKRIAETTVVNSFNSWHLTDAGTDTLDKIFLLSIEETILYFGDSGALENWSAPDDGLVAGSHEDDWFIDDRYNSVRQAKIGLEVDYDYLAKKAEGSGFDFDKVVRERGFEPNEYVAIINKQIKDEEEKNGGYNWWLRSPGITSGHAAYVASVGALGVGGDAVNSEKGVRPAMWIKLNVGEVVDTSASKGFYPNTLPTPSGDFYIADYANILAPVIYGDNLLEWIVDIHEDGFAKYLPGAELVVVTIPSLGDASAEDYAQNLLDSWNVGKAPNEDCGMLLLLAPNDNQAAFAVEPGLHDLISEELIDEYFNTPFSSGSKTFWDCWNQDLYVEAMTTFIDHIEDDWLYGIMPSIEIKTFVATSSLEFDVEYPLVKYSAEEPAWVNLADWKGHITFSGDGTYEMMYVVRHSDVGVKSIGTFTMTDPSEINLKQSAYSDGGAYTDFFSEMVATVDENTITVQYVNSDVRITFQKDADSKEQSGLSASANTTAIEGSLQQIILGEWENEYPPYTEYSNQYITTFFEDGTVAVKGWRNRDTGTYTIENSSVVAVFTDCRFSNPDSLEYEKLDQQYTCIYTYDEATQKLERSFSQEISSNDISGPLTKIS